jgi:hypothetical protein
MRYACVLALLAASLVLGGAQEGTDYTMQDGNKCGPTGTAVKAEVKALNLRKNQVAPPTADDIDTDVTLAAMLTPGDDEDRFDATKAARIVGFVMDVKVGGVETCNCKARNPLDRDTHIELASAPNAPNNQRVIVEVTPRLRLKMKHNGMNSADWTTNTLQSHGPNGIKGKWVEVAGWLLFDIEHTDGAENSSPGNPTNWRATCWEIHPVTELTVLDGAPATHHELAPATLRVLQQSHARTVTRSPARRDTIEKRNKHNRETYDEDR